MEEIIQKEDLRLLVELGFAACMAGQISDARNIFQALRQYDASTEAVQLGLALTYLVTDEFEKGDEILNALSDGSDVLGFKVLSKALQRKTDEAKSLYESIADKDAVSAKMAKAVLEARQ
ncbi:MAG: hypothetical protein IJ228_10670 [Succinivibrio sp.]|nr:hypothetical protein [Succinivibrio sp.]